MKFVIGLVCVLAVCIVGMAHTVETTSGAVIESSRIIGLPEVITLDNGGVSIEVDSDRIMSLQLSGGTATIVTTTSESLSGLTSLQISSITLKTETGETTIPLEQVNRIVFDRDSERLRIGSALAELEDGRRFEGDLSGSFPDDLTLVSGGIATSTRVRSITSIQLGEPTTIETTSGSVSGNLQTSLPSWVELDTRFGRYRVPVEMVSSIQLTPSRSLSLAETSTNTVGIGFKIWQGLPFVVGNLSLGNFGADCALGFGSVTGSGSIVDVTALWYSGTVRYIVLLPGLDTFIRPYIGVGVIGLSAIASSGSASASVSTFGFDAGIGIDIPLSSLGIPLTLFTGSDWSFLGGSGSLVYQLGVRLDFSL